MTARRTVALHSLGRVEYADGLTMQARFTEARQQGLCPEALLLLEHSPVVTLGRAATQANVIASREELARVGIDVFETDRGGDVTYHGPGQLVGYPLLDLPPGRQDVRRYVRDLEETLIRTIAHFGIEGMREEKWPGVWVRQGSRGQVAKIAAIGVHISRWSTRHGFALNVDPDLSHFGLIVPCGIREAGVTSMRAVLGREISVAEVETVLARNFSEIFEVELAPPADPPQRTTAVVVVRDGHVLLVRRTPARGGFWQIITGRVEAGESPAISAAREVREETGVELTIEPLGYEHTFAWGEALPPKLVREEAFVARWSGAPDVRLDPREHDAFEWVPFAQALERVPHAGLRAAIRRAAFGPHARLGPRVGSSAPA